MPISPRLSKKACFIAGAGHSGSTLLGFILGSHSQGFYCGEAAKSRYLQDDSKKLIKRVCKLCGENCQIWGDFQVSQ
ncbi:MAG: sulfotransferase, partial [Microcoleus sp. SIO2G3]|nr:sulfotransferase [Microcoleus sp. SIO2G3]